MSNNLKAKFKDAQKKGEKKDMFHIKQGGIWIQTHAEPHWGAGPTFDEIVGNLLFGADVLRIGIIHKSRDGLGGRGGRPKNHETSQGGVGGSAKKSRRQFFT